MSTSKPRIGGLAAAATIIGLASCSPPTNCLRFSDCADGLTCWEGKCVPLPGSVPEAGADGLSSDGLDAAAAGPEAAPSGPSDGALLEASGNGDATDEDSTATGDDAAGDAAGDATVE